MTIKCQSHTILKNAYTGKDVYVLGSGTSMQFINKTFFEDKFTIGANLIYQYFPVNFCVFKHSQFIDDAVGKCKVIISSKHDCGDITKEIVNNKNVDYFFTHKKGRFGELEDNFRENLESLGKDEDIFVSYSTITSCIHLAAYMGARNIIVCGHDCGWIDGLSHIEGYSKRIIDYYGSEEKFNEYYNYWLERINSDTIRLKEKIKEIYGCEIYSLNPFINFRLEGHDYVTKK